MSNLRWLLLAVLALAGSASAQSAFVHFDGTQIGDRLGQSVSSAGDVDGDGCDDVAVGSPGYDVTTTVTYFDAGRAQIYSGRTGALLRDYLGSGPSEELGFAVAGVGDVNLDGVPDLAVGRPGALQAIVQLGGARVYSGATGAALFTTGGIASDNARLGHAIAALGDATFDGVPDFAIGAPFYNPSSSYPDAGGVFVVSGPGSIGTPLWIAVGGAEYGWSIAALGDVNSNGSIDMAIGSPGYGAFPFYSDSGLVEVRATNGSYVYGLTPTAYPDRRFGSSVASLGDIDGDLIADLAVGEEGEMIAAGADAGSIRLYRGPNGFNLGVIYGLASGEKLGHSVAGPGDVDGDGVPDILGGAPFSNVSSPFGVNDAGVARLYSGATQALLETYSPLVPNALGGSAVARAGDVNADGLADLLLGAPSFGGIGGMEGSAFLHLGGAVDASWSVYGPSVSGTLGPPALALASDPKLCQSNTLKFTSSASVTTAGMLFLGTASASLPTGYGGNVLVAPPWIASNVVLGAGVTNLPTTIPCDSTLNGVSIYLQLLQSDPGAPKGVAFSRGLQVTFGT